MKKCGWVGVQARTRNGWLLIMLLWCGRANLAEGSSLFAEACAEPGTNVNYQGCATTTDTTLVQQTYSVTATPNTSLSASATSQARSYGELSMTGSISGTGVVGNGHSLFAYIANRVDASDTLHLNVSSGTLRFIWNLSGSAVYNENRIGGHPFLVEFFGVGPLAPIVVDVPFTNGSLSTLFTLEAYVACSTDGYTCLGNANYDLGHTATLTQVQVFDSLGTLVSNPVITADSGFGYSALTSAPEPAGFPILALSLAAIGAAAQRRSSKWKKGPG
jgi:hypothetical protein